MGAPFEGRASHQPRRMRFVAAQKRRCRAARSPADEVAGRGLVLKVNTEEYPTVAAQIRVQSIPYFVLLRRGIIIAERAGVTPRAEMRRWFAMAA